MASSIFPIGPVKGSRWAGDIRLKNSMSVSLWSDATSRACVSCTHKRDTQKDKEQERTCHKIVPGKETKHRKIWDVWSNTLPRRNPQLGMFWKLRKAKQNKSNESLQRQN